MGEYEGLNRAGRRALQRKRGGARRAATSSGAVLALGTSLVGGALPASAGVAGLEPPSFVVTIPGDVVDNQDQETSLREAVNLANSNNDANQITFEAGLLHVEVEDGDIDITNPVTITGFGVTVEAVIAAEGAPHRIFDVFDTFDVGVAFPLVTVRGLTLTDGRAFGLDGDGNGGAIRAGAVQLVLDSVAVQNNAAWSGGGGVFIGPEGELRLTNTTITGNTAPTGGGVMAVGYVAPPPPQNGAGAAAVPPDVGGIVIDRSTITGNVAAVGSPFAKYNEGFGGGLVAYSEDLTIENSTVSGNTADLDAGGIFLYDTQASIEHSTINGNLVGADGGGTAGGLLMEASSGFLGHSIFANSLFTQPPQPDGPVQGDTFGGPPFDLVIGGESGFDGEYLLIEALDDPGDGLLVSGPAIITSDPRLAPLAQDGATASHRPLPGSPVINAGDPLIVDPPETDQTGGPRIVEARIDIGSVESRPQGAPDPDPAQGGPDPDPCVGAPEDGFLDVPGEGAPGGPTANPNVHEFAVDCITFLGFTIGGPEGAPTNIYGPAGNVSRAQMASYLTRLITKAGVTLNPSPPDAFDDAPTVHDLAINQLALAGIVQGRAPRVYDPTGSVSRAEMATFLSRTYEFITGNALPVGPDAFPDDDGNTHESAINALAFAEIAQGKVDGTYAPGEGVRRDQMASFLTRFVRRLAQDDAFPVND